MINILYALGLAITYTELKTVFLRVPRLVSTIFTNHIVRIIAISFLIRSGGINWHLSFVLGFLMYLFILGLNYIEIYWLGWEENKKEWEDDLSFKRLFWFDKAPLKN